MVALIPKDINASEPWNDIVAVGSISRVVYYGFAPRGHYVLCHSPTRWPSSVDLLEPWKYKADRPEAENLDVSQRFQGCHRAGSNIVTHVNATLEADILLVENVVDLVDCMTEVGNIK